MNCATDGEGRMKEYIVGIENEHSHALDVCYKEELIRCKDCKYHYYHEMLKQDYCNITNMQFGEVEPNGYCHRAERKEK